MSKTRVMSAAALVVTGLLVSGCGSASPGAAAKVGDQTISKAEVDKTATALCSAFEDQIKAQGTAVAMSAVRRDTLHTLVTRDIANQIADQYDIKPGAVYMRELANRRAEVAASQPAELRDYVITYMTTRSLISDVLEQAARINLTEAGVPSPSPDQITQAAQDLAETWPKSNGVEIDPVYGLDSALAPIDTNLSVAVSEGALAGMADEPDPTYVSSLPASQRCG